MNIWKIFETLKAGEPVPWQMNFQTPATPVMEKVVDLHNLLLVIMACVGSVVIALVFYVLWRYRASKNPVPSKVSHHTLLEVVWTAIPVLILFVIMVPSLKLLYFMDTVAPAELTVKVTGHQWYWTYTYPDHNIEFDSLNVEDKDLSSGQRRLLEVDRRMVVPVGTVVRVQLTSADVLHSWAVPSFGIKRDTIPGKLSETWFKAQKEGIYRGQCSELCGAKHGFMPIVVEVVSKEKFLQWLQTQQKHAQRHQKNEVI